METGLVNKSIFIVMPAYNAEKTLLKTYYSIPPFLRHNVILIDDFSKDNTLEIAGQLNLITRKHFRNKGYGANQKTCYKLAIEFKADIIVMLHPDFQYIGEDIPELIAPIMEGKKDMMLGCRIRKARKGNMPLWKYISNRFLTIIEKLVLHNYELHEFHSGFRAYSSDFLIKSKFWRFNDDFSFDSQMIFFALKNNYRVGEIDTETRYFNDASSIKFEKALKYALKTLYLLCK